MMPCSMLPQVSQPTTIAPGRVLSTDESRILLGRFDVWTCVYHHHKEHYHKPSSCVLLYDCFSWVGSWFGVESLETI